MKKLSIIILTIIIFGGVFLININNVSSKKASISKKKINNKNESFYIDIKGYVKEPGVYKVTSKNIVNDAINMAGGLLSNATTLNINLSKKLEKEMVIIISKKSDLVKELNDNHTCNSNNVDYTNCLKENKNVSIISSTNSSQSNTSSSKSDKIININEADLNSLMTLDSIGQKKAESIVKYREENGNFNTIEDIKNVSGIGDSLFAKIKNNITV